MSIPVAAKINGQVIELYDRHGTRVNFVSATGMAYGEKWVSAYVNGNILVATSERGTLITWQLGENGSVVVVGRR
jgi:hypothetical protein